MQIAKQLEQEKVLIPSAYYASLGRKTRKQYTNPYAWDQKTVAGILANQQYTGCTVNFMTTTVSYKVHKTVYKPKDEWQIIPNTQPAIIDEDTWKRVQELRENRIRPTATGRTSLFSGKVFCADCGSKLHFCAAKSLNANQEHYRCANYKSGRGNCQIHYIRNVVLEKIVLEAINSLADFVRCYEPVFLYLMAQKDIVSKRTETNRLKSSIESGKRRIQDLDKLIERTSSMAFMKTFLIGMISSLISQGMLEFRSSMSQHQSWSRLSLPVLSNYPSGNVLFFKCESQDTHRKRLQCTSI